MMPGVVVRIRTPLVQIVPKEGLQVKSSLTVRIDSDLKDEAAKLGGRYELVLLLGHS